MKRLLVLCVAAALVTACKKKEPEATPPAAPVEAAQADSEPSGDSNEQAAADEPAQEEDEKVVLDASMAERYLAYKKELIDLALAGKKKFEELEKSKDKEGGAFDTAVFVKKAADLNDELTKSMDAAKKKSGFTHAQLEALNEISLQIQIAHMTKKENPVAAFEKAFEEGKANATPEQLAEARAQIDEMKKNLSDMFNAADARAKYGDEIVDALFARAAEFDALVTGSAE